MRAYHMLRVTFGWMCDWICASAYRMLKKFFPLVRTVRTHVLQLLGSSQCRQNNNNNKIFKKKRIDDDGIDYETSINRSDVKPNADTKRPVRMVQFLALNKEFVTPQTLIY